MIHWRRHACRAGLLAIAAWVAAVSFKSYLGPGLVMPLLAMVSLC